MIRQCVFGGTTNRQDFLPRDRTGNRRFLPVTVYPERAEVHILENEHASRAYIDQMWAEAMVIYRSKNYRLSFNDEMNRYLTEHQQDFMQEDTQAGMIFAFLEDFEGDRVCSKLLYGGGAGSYQSARRLGDAQHLRNHEHGNRQRFNQRLDIAQKPEAIRQIRLTKRLGTHRQNNR